MIAVVGCGNPNRGDDGAGPEIIRALRQSPAAQSPSVRILDAGTDGMAAMFAARGCRTLIVVDACRSGSEPGAMFEAPGSVLEQSYMPSLNLHDFRWDHALYAGRKMFGDSFPADIVVLLIEAETTDFGIGLSPPVATTAQKAIERIEALIRERLAADEAAP